jgi:hypothetical protein
MISDQQAATALIVDICAILSFIYRLRLCTDIGRAAHPGEEKQKGVGGERCATIQLAEEELAGFDISQRMHLLSVYLSAEEIWFARDSTRTRNF